MMSFIIKLSCYRNKPSRLFLLPVAVPEFDVSSGLQDLSVLQPGELGVRLALRLAGEDGGGADRAGDGLRRLNKLCWSFERGGKINIISGGATIQKIHD